MRATVMILLTVPLLATAHDKPMQADLKALAGTWMAIGGEAMGKEIPQGELTLQWTFEAAGKAALADRKQGNESPFTYTLDPAKEPRHITLTYVGPLKALKGSKQFGIYKIEKGTLFLCLSIPGATEKDRPTAFTSKGGKVMLMRLERAKVSK